MIINDLTGILYDTNSGIFSDKEHRWFPKYENSWSQETPTSQGIN